MRHLQKHNEKELHQLAGALLDFETLTSSEITQVWRPPFLLGSCIHRRMTRRNSRQDQHCQIAVESLLPLPTGALPSS